MPDPDAGFAALRAACAPGGGMGVMVYAPLGRSGVYPLQEAFGAVLADLPPKDRLSAARTILDRVPEDHPFKRNRRVGDHTASDAGFYDLLLHGQDRAYDVAQLVATLTGAGWALRSFVMPALYDVSRFASVPPGLDRVAAMAIAEKLRGTMKTHIAYAVPSGAAQRDPDEYDHTCIPHLSGGAGSALAQVVSGGKPVSIMVNGGREGLTLPKAAAPLIARIDGKRTVADIGAGVPPSVFGELWGGIARELAGFGLLHYSRFGV